MKLKTTLLAAAAAFMVAPAAHAYEGLYGAIGAGLSHMKNGDIEALGGPVLFDTEQDINKGIGVYTALGYAWGNMWRTELELSYRDNDINAWLPDAGVGFVGFPSGTLSGDMASSAIMFNVIRDLNSGTAFTPYIGAGAGFARTKAELFGTNILEPNSPLLVNDNNTKFAYQGIAGFAVGLAENLMLDISYRYFRSLDNKFDGTLNGLPFTYKADNVSHSVFAGLRWNFGAAAAPVQYKDCWDGSSVPVSAECPPRLIEDTSGTAEPIGVIVYFDYDKSNLTAEADALVREAAQRALQNDIQNVKVEGNADRSGGSAYNQALSQRRANVVRDALIRYGVPADRVTTAAFGEDNPAKPTEDGVREPLNRRTEVTISFQ